jgi:hypothetical protein
MIRRVSWIAWAAGLAVLGVYVALGQVGGEILLAVVLDVPGDTFGCGEGTAPCGLHYRIFNGLTGAAEVNERGRLDGHPRYRSKAGRYETDAGISGNYPSVAGRYDVPFFVVWDGVTQPSSPGHVGYYGTQSQIVRHGEVGDSRVLNCASGMQSGACFEPLSSATTGQFLRSGIGPVGGLAPIPVPEVASSNETRIMVGWEVARGMTVVDGAPPGVTGYRLYAFRGRGPSDRALASSTQVAESGSLMETRAEVPTDHPALVGAQEVTFALKLVYQGGLESLYFSANSEPHRLEEDEDEEEEEEGEDEAQDTDADGYDDGEDNCPRMPNPDQADEDADGRGDACDPPEAKEGEPEAEDEPQARATAEGQPPGGVPAGTAPAPPPSPALIPQPAAAAVPDADADGVPSIMDNCPGLANPGQQDLDLDGKGDACDGDMDGDGTADGADCAPADGGAFRGGSDAPGPLQLAGRERAVLSWPAAEGEAYALFAGTLPIADELSYGHACLFRGLRRGQAVVEAVPAPGTIAYYLVAGETACGVGPPGFTSAGLARPAGESCLVASFTGALPASPWGWEILGGPGETFLMTLVLEASPDLADLYAVSLELIFDPGLVTPVGAPEPGPLLAEPGAQLRIDTDTEGIDSGRLGVGLSRTGLRGGLPQGADGGAVVTLRWRALAHGPLPFRVHALRALDSSFEELRAAPPGTSFAVLTR